jgi:hypothetical protein
MNKKEYVNEGRMKNKEQKENLKKTERHTNKVNEVS